MITTFFIFSHFRLFILFPTDFWVHLLIGVDIKGHLFALLDILFMHALFWLHILVSLCRPSILSFDTCIYLKGVTCTQFFPYGIAMAPLWA